MLSKHINPDKLIRESKDKKSNHHHLTGKDSDSTPHPYGARYGITSIPKFHIPSKGASAETTYQLIHDELSLDGSPSLNLASFVQTWMPEPANRLMLENVSKNLIDQDEYPMTQEIHTRCVSILANLWHAPSTHQAIGTATTGSSEAIQLGGLAMKRRWQERRKAEGKSIHEPGPNIIMGANAQVALEKFARYFEVECRLVPVSVESKYRLDPKKAMEYVDENTIGVYVILGSTYTGHYEPVKEMSDLLDEYELKTGIYVPIHVDGASGAFIAPFAHPKLLWDFKLPRVVSINTSGHKFGLAYVGVGWVVWRSKEHLPKDLIFELHYLGSVEYSFSLNFSRPAAPIIAQYFNFVHLGFEGYRAVAKDDLKNARLLSRALEKSGWYTVLSDIHRPKAENILQKSAHDDFDEENTENYEEGLPVVAFRFSDSFQKSYPEIQQKWIQVLLRAKGWIVPNYELAPDLEQVQILRVVVKENMTESLVDRLLEDIVDVTQDLIKQESPTNALTLLGNHSRKNRDNSGKMDEGSGSEYSERVRKGLGMLKIRPAEC
ncbi:glutamate decarboxylase [Suillus americanus]|nr:glutamate decarboxylase [Suillus americanus]